MTEEIQTAEPLLIPVQPLSDPSIEVKRPRGRPRKTAADPSAASSTVSFDDSPVGTPVTTIPNIFSGSHSMDNSDTFTLDSTIQAIFPDSLIPEQEMPVVTPLEFAKLEILGSGVNSKVVEDMLQICCQNIEKHMFRMVFSRLAQLPYMNEALLWRVVKSMSRYVNRGSIGMLRINGPLAATTLRSMGKGIEFRQAGFEPVPVQELAMYFTNEG